MIEVHRKKCFDVIRQSKVQTFCKSIAFCEHVGKSSERYKTKRFSLHFSVPDQAQIGANCCFWDKSDST